MSREEHKRRSSRVVKVGGSVMEWCGFTRAFEDWLARQTPAPTLFVAGGGALADAIRDLDRTVDADVRVVHHLAVRAMTVNGFVLSALFPRLDWVSDLDAWVGVRDRCAHGVLDPAPFLVRDESKHPDDCLPQGWHVTSDSIAARVAEIVEADELILVKSALPESATELNLQAVATSGLVDPYFPISAQSIPRIRVVNLREPGYAEVELKLV